jgi:phosphopantothenoylcysteine synthetase/decarboxylase
MTERAPHLLLGVTGSIAAYRTPDLAAKLRRRGFEVRTILSPAAREFVTKTSLACMARGEVYADEEKLIDNWRPSHIELAEWADVALIAPATAATIGKLALGVCDNLLTDTFMALGPNVQKYFAPAMNTNMYNQPAVQSNIETLKNNGYVFIEPREGELACGVMGKGLMATLDTIVATVVEKPAKDVGHTYTINPEFDEGLIGLA